MPKPHYDRWTREKLIQTIRKQQDLIERQTSIITAYETIEANTDDQQTGIAALRTWMQDVEKRLAYLEDTVFQDNL